MAQTAEIYSKQIRRTPTLSREDQLALARRYKAGDLSAGQKLVAANLRYAQKVAASYSGYLCAIEDLIQEANVGMLRALKRFDPEQGYNFITYAVWWMRATLNMFVMHSSSIVKFGTTNYERSGFFKVRAAFAKHRAQNPYADDDDLFGLVAHELSIAKENVIGIYERTTHKDHSLNRALPGSKSTTHQDLLEDATEPLDSSIFSEQVRAAVFEAVNTIRLNHNQQYILTHRLYTDRPETLQKIGEDLGMSRERARQIEMDVRKRLAPLLRHLV